MIKDFFKSLFTNNIQGSTMAMASVYKYNEETFVGRYRGSVVHKGKKYYKYELGDESIMFTVKEASFVQSLATKKSIKVSRANNNRGLFRKKQIGLISIMKG